MKICSIFADEEDSKLWAVCYPEDADDLDIFSKLFDQWNDTEFLLNFFLENIDSLNDPFWGGMTVDEAITQVQEEAEDFEIQLYSIETKQPGFETISINSIFKPLHDNIYSIHFTNEQHRKGKPNLLKPMIRLYAIELEDGTLIITGGGIKLTKTMENNLVEEKKQLTRVQNFLRAEGISDKLGLRTD
jgi:hypothetical protein